MKKLRSEVQRISYKIVSLKKIQNSIRLNGMPCDRNNSGIILSCLNAYGFLLLDIAKHHPELKLNVGVTYKQFLSACLDNDFIDIISFFDDTRQMLVRLIEPQSKRLLRSRIANIASSNNICRWKELIAPITGLIDQFSTTASFQPRYLKDISIFLVFCKKLQFTNIDLERQMLDDYYATEAKFDDFAYDAEIIESIKEVIEEWFKEFRITEFKPFFGNGATANGPLSKFDKYFKIQVDDALLRNINVDKSLTTEYFPLGYSYGLQRCSKVQFVPKNAKKLRVISMEEQGLMYFQQSMRISLEKYVKSHDVMRNIIMFGDQTRNQHLAMTGSLVNNTSTLDLSAASDSVSLELVKRLFSGLPHILRFLLAFRSDKTLLPDKRIIKLNKYAPMGSALSFPVECIVFAAVVESCYRRIPSDSIEKITSVKQFSVFGDDIICNDYVTDDVIETLQKVGFKVNVEKSFIGDVHFRESCGKEYFNGVDVTPVYYRLPSLFGKVSPTTLSAMAGFTHTCHDNYLTELARDTIRHGTRRFKKLAFTNDSKDTSKFMTYSHGLNSNLPLLRSKSQDWQDDYRVARACLTKNGDSNQLILLEDAVLYFEWLRDHSGHSEFSYLDILYPEEAVQNTVDQSTNILGWQTVLAV